VLQAVLQEDERVLWSGRPRALAYVMGSAVLTLPLGILAVVSAATWTAGVGLQQFPPWARIVLLVVLVFAAHMLVLRPLLGIRLARRTHYAVTNRRALVVCDAWGRRVQQLHHDEGTLIVVPGPALGKIQFGRTAASSADILLLGRAAIPGFYGLPDLEPPLAALRSVRGDLPQAT